MGDAAKPSILKRKALDGLAGHKARSMSPEKAMTLSMALSAQNGLGLACEVTRVRRSMVTHETLIGMLDSESLLAILEGENGARAALAIDMQVLSGFVESQTLGRVLPQPAVDRVPTLVDAALVTPFVEDALARFVTLLTTDEPPKWLQHYKFGAVTEDTRTLALSLKAHEFHFLLMDVVLEGGAKKGTLGIAFPDFEPAMEVPDGGADLGDALRPFQENLLQASATLTAVVGRLTMSIGDVQALQVGEMLSLPVEATKETTLEAVGGERVTEVRLGQINGMRAVRLVGEFAQVQENGGPKVVPEEDVSLPEPQDVNTVPESAPLPEVSVPEVPELPDLDAAMDGLGDFDLPDLPDIGDLPDLPDLGELPDLPDLDLTGS